MTRLFLALSAALLVLTGIAAAKDSSDRRYLTIQEQYQRDYPGTKKLDPQVQQLFPQFADAKRGDTFRVERCISCHVPDIAIIGPQKAAERLVKDFLTYEPDHARITKVYGLSLQHPTAITQQLYDKYGEDSYATSDGFHPYTVPGDTPGTVQTAQLPGFIPRFLSPAQNGGKELGLDAVGCIVCHNGSRLATGDTDAHTNLIINPEYSWTEGASLYYKYCATCHGGLGEGKVGPPLSNQDRLGYFNEDYYYRCIEYGYTDFEHVGSVMPAWGSASPDFHYDPVRDKQTGQVTRVLSEDQINILVQFIRHWEQYDTLP
jgi:Cytochrome C oxidase, cbb3-type, subunit III